MKCFRCKRPADPLDIAQGLYHPVLVDGVVSDICPTCVRLICEEWIKAYREVAKLKIS